MQISNRRYWGILISLLLIIAIVYYFNDIVTWLVVAWIISLLGSPLMQILSKIKIGRFQLNASFRALIVLSIFYTIFGLFFYIFVPVIIEQGRNLAGVNYEGIAKSLEQPASKLNNWLIQKGFIEGDLSDRDQKPNPQSQVPSSHLKVNLLMDSTGVHFDGSFEDEEREIGSTKITHTSIHVDSIILAQGDTITKTNIGLNIQVDLGEKPNTEQIHKDPTAVVKPTDNPIEKLQKQFIAFFNPAKIPLLFSYIISFFGHIIVSLTSVTFIAFFYLKDEALFGRAIKSAVPNAYMKEVDLALHRISELLFRYFSGLLVQISIITLYLSTLLSVVGVPNAVLIAFFAALINLIPYLGPVIGALFGILVTISSNVDADFYLTTLPLLFHVVWIFGTIQILDGFILQPFIFSNSVMAHPLEIFIVVIAGAKIGGIPGMIVAIPIYTIIRVVASVFLSQFKIVQKLTKQLTETALEESDEPPNNE